MAFSSICLSFLMLSCELGLLVAAQDQQVQFNQVINLNGDMQLNRLVFPDNSKIETFSQAQKQMIVNQNPNPLSANHVVGSTGQPFVQLSQNSMTIQTNKATDLVGAQVEMSIDPNIIQQMGVSPDNTFVAQLSSDRQAWVIMEGIKSVNTTDNTVRMIKMTSLDGEYMAVGRQTVETSNVLTTFNQNQQVQIAGSGLQEVEFTDGFRMSIRASQPMTLKTDVVNGISSSMTPGGIMSVNNYRYKVTSNLAGVATDLNSMVAVVQLPLNAQRIMTMAQQMGAQPNSAISLGVAQRVVLQNPGGSSVQNLQRRQDPSSASSATSSTSAADAAASSGSTSAATDSTAAADTTSSTSTSAQAASTPIQNGANQPATAATQTQAAIPAATQLLLSPTFSPISAQALLDSQNNRIAIPVSQIDGEFIITMGMTGSGTIQVTPASSGTAAGAQGQPAISAAGAQPSQQPEGNQTAGAPATGSVLARQAAAAPQGSIVMTMAQLQEMAQRQATGGVVPVWSMMSSYVTQQAAQPQGSLVKGRTVKGFKAVPFKDVVCEVAATGSDMSYTTPPITTATSYGAIETFSALQSAPALLTRFTPSAQCSTDWFWDTGVLRSSSTAFSDAAHNTQWNTCQPYNVTKPTYSAGICPERSEFKSVTQVSWDGVTELYYVGACCAITASLQAYDSGDATGLYGCIATVTSSQVAATWVQENYEPTAVISKGPITVIAEPLYMVWHQGDTSLHSESDASSLRAAMGLAMPSSTSTNPATMVEYHSTTTNKISPGAIAGVAVGFAVCVIGMGILCYIIFVRRKRIKTSPSKPTEPGESTGNPNAWSNREVYGGSLQLDIPNNANKTHSFVELNTVESTGSRTPQTPYTPQMLGRAKNDDMFTVEQKMLLH
ncbi:hypothetical protein SCUP234_00921 [Seiridium cupressi]